MEEFTFKFNPQEMGVIQEGIGKVPYERAAPLVATIQRQIAEQMATAEKKPVTASAKSK